MERIKFSLSIIWAGLFGKKQFSLINALTMILGFFPLIIALGTMFFFISMVDVMPQMPEGNGISIKAKFAAEKERDINDFVYSLTGNVSDAFFLCHHYTVVANDEYRKAVGIQGYSSNYFDYNTSKLLEGRMPTEEEIATNAKVCVLAKSSRAIYRNIKVGDIVTISGVEFEVIGSAYVNKGTLLVPYGALEEFLGIDDTYKMEYDIYVQTEQTADIDAVRAEFKEHKWAIDKIEPMEEFYKSIADLRDRLNYQRALTALPAIVFALIGVAMIMVGKMKDSDYLTGVKLALGATKANVFMDLFLENAAIAAVAVALDSILAHAFYPVLQKYVEMELDYRVYIAAAAIALLVCVVVTGVTTLISFRKSVVDIMKEKA